MANDPTYSYCYSPTKTDYVLEANKLKKKNRKLTDQLEEANNTMNDVLHALKLGPCNDWAKRAIERYQEKYSKTEDD